MEKGDEAIKNSNPIEDNDEFWRLFHELGGKLRALKSDTDTVDVGSRFMPRVESLNTEKCLQELLRTQREFSGSISRLEEDVTLLKKLAYRLNAGEDYDFLMSMFSKEAELKCDLGMLKSIFILLWKQINGSKEELIGCNALLTDLCFWMNQLKRETTYDKAEVNSIGQESKTTLFLWMIQVEKITRQANAGAVPPLLKDSIAGLIDEDLQKLTEFFTASMLHLKSRNDALKAKSPSCFVTAKAVMQLAIAVQESICSVIRGKAMEDYSQVMKAEMAAAQEDTSYLLMALGHVKSLFSSEV